MEENAMKQPLREEAAESGPGCILTREAILDKTDVTISPPIPIPEWGGAVHLRTWSGSKREQHEKHMAELQAKAAKTGKPIDPSGVRARILVDSICDAHGKVLFTAEDIQALTLKSGVVLDRLFDRAMKLNGLDAKAVENAEKN